MIPSTQQGEDGRGNSTHTACRGDSTDTTFEGCKTLLQDIGRRIIEACVEVSWDLQVKDPCCMIAALKRKGVSLIERYSRRAVVCCWRVGVMEGGSRYVLAHCLQSFCRVNKEGEEGVMSAKCDKKKARCNH